ncbi:MAG: tetratricopeptide repeat protein [Acidobacteria bacterium]|nr:MAG: tetratricopeptide repeat protein [Acidobacteriota bacterium]
MRRVPTTRLICALLGLYLCFWTRAAHGSPDNLDDAQRQVARATDLVQQGDLRNAEAELRQAVRLAPNESAYLAFLGAVLGMEQKLPESTSYLEKALRLDPLDLRTRRNLASNQFQMGQFQAARQNLERVLKVESGETTSILLLGMVDEELKDYQNALALLESVPQEVQKHSKAQVALARCYYQTGRSDKAREVLRGLESHSDGPQGIFLGGQAADHAGDFDLAEQLFRSVWATYPDRASLGYNVALAQYHAGHIKESQATLQGLLDAGHETSDIEDLMAWCEFKQDHIKEAVSHMDRAIDLDPSRESNYLDVGMMLLHDNRYNGALVAGRKAVDVAPHSYKAYRFLGLAQYKLGELKAAEKTYAHAVELNPRDQQSLLGLASAQVDDGRIDEAEATFGKAIAYFPKDANLYLQYGRMLLTYRGANGSRIEARAVALLTRAIALDTSLAEAHYLLGNLDLTKGQTEKALPELELAVKLDPKPSGAHYALARAYLRLGRQEDGMEQMRLFQQLKATEKKGTATLAGSPGPADRNNSKE